MQQKFWRGKCCLLLTSQGRTTPLTNNNFLAVGQFWRKYRGSWKIFTFVWGKYVSKKSEQKIIVDGKHDGRKGRRPDSYMAFLHKTFDKWALNWNFPIANELWNSGGSFHTSLWAWPCTPKHIRCLPNNFFLGVSVKCSWGVGSAVSG